jgi:hypothetical protein
MSAARKLVPFVFFGALTVFTGANGIYHVVLCFRELFAGNMAAWRSFLAAELALLFAWRFLQITAISWVIYRGVARNAKVRVKSGMVGRIVFMVATGAAAFGYLLAKFLFTMPLWVRHLGHVAIAVLLFCTFTYPWSRRRNLPNIPPEPLSEAVLPKSLRPVRSGGPIITVGLVLLLAFSLLLILFLTHGHAF